MLASVKAIYLASRKEYDQLFNKYLARPVAACVVALLAKTPITPNQVTIASTAALVLAALLFVLWPEASGGVCAALIVLFSFVLDCADGMLARHKKIASVQGHLFDFFTDGLKALMLVGAIAARLWRSGGYGPALDGSVAIVYWVPSSDAFFAAGMLGVAVVASAASLTNFVRRPELTGKETGVAAHYEIAGVKRGPVALVFTFLRLLNHYPAHLWLFALLGRLDAFFWMYVAINTLYLAKGWLGLLVRFGGRASTRE